jgi:hypothetical protein
MVRDVGAAATAVTSRPATAQGNSTMRPDRMAVKSILGENGASGERQGEAVIEL